MVSSLTTLRGLELPTVGGDAGTWGTELNNGVMGVLDNILGATTTLFSSNGASVTLTQSQAQVQRLNLVSSAAMTITLQNSSYGNGGYIANTGSQPVTFQTTAAAGGTITLGPTVQSWIYSDGTNVSAAPDGPLFASDGSSGGVLNTANNSQLQIVALSTGANNAITFFKYSGGAYTQEYAINSSGESVGRTDGVYGFNTFAATAGTLGETFTVANSSGTNMSNGVVTALGAVTPTAGDYLIFGSANFTMSAGLASFQKSGFAIGVPAFSGSFANLSYNSQIMGTQSITFPPVALSLTGSTIITLEGQVSFSSGTCTATGNLTCLRLR